MDRRHSTYRVVELETSLLEAGDLNEGAMEEDAQQHITFLLQEIDANICAAHRSATQICSTVRRHHQILRQIHEASQVWRPLFESFAVQPAAARRPAVTPGPPPASARPSSPSGSSVSGDHRDHTTRNLSFSDDETETDSIMVDEHTFKTTTLRRLGHPNVDESLNATMSSDRLPSMARTPYLNNHGSRSTSKAPQGVSILSENATNWTPSLTSPPRTDVLKVQARANAGQHTPPSAISSIHPASPNVSRDLMKIGAFEFTPPRAKSPRSPAPPADAHAADMSPVSPAMPRFATVAAPESAAKQASSSANDIEESKSDSSPLRSSQRKRKRPGTPPRAATPPRTTTGTPARRPSPAASLSTPGSYTSLRRKYSVPDYSTPLRARSSPANTKTVESIRKATEELMRQAESPMTPSFEMPSPLLRTQLKAMTPHTPLSNRLVGANLDIGTTSQEAKLHDYDESFEAGEPAPEFQLSLFPSAFQRGIGAVQMSTLYSKFQGLGDDKPALSVDQLADALPDYGKERIEILLDTLVSRRLLRPFVVEGIMFWQIPI